MIASSGHRYILEIGVHMKRIELIDLAHQTAMEFMKLGIAIGSGESHDDVLAHEMLRSLFSGIHGLPSSVDDQAQDIYDFDVAKRADDGTRIPAADIYREIDENI